MTEAVAAPLSRVWMMRRFLNLVTVLSVLASVAVLVVWVRSHFARDVLACAPVTVTPEGHRSGVYMLHTREGIFTVDAVRRHLTIAAMPAREYADHLDLAEAEHRVAGEWTWMTRPPAAFPSTKGRPLLPRWLRRPSREGQDPRLPVPSDRVEHAVLVRALAGLAPARRAHHSEAATKPIETHRHVPGVRLRPPCHATKVSRVRPHPRPDNVQKRLLLNRLTVERDVCDRSASIELAHEILRSILHGDEGLMISGSGHRLFTGRVRQVISLLCDTGAAAFWSSGFASARSLSSMWRLRCS